MKRFVTYLYECERGNKIKNVGFIRVNVHDEETSMEIYIRNLARNLDEGTVYALVQKEGLRGIRLTDVSVAKGQSDAEIVFKTKDITGSGFSLKDIVGIGIPMKSELYIASCWKDECVDEITRGEFVKIEERREELDNTLIAATDTIWESPTPSYEKIDLSQIRDLPSPNWHFATNSFLVHGFWNYGYLVLKKEMEEDKEKLSLGVPGVYERPEAVMAVLFGFPNFETILVEEIEPLEKEKNQETKEGTFGCWFANLKM